MNSRRMFSERWIVIAAFAFSSAIPVAHAQIDGHGPDAWRVTGIAAHGLDARAGPGAAYPVITRFASDERGLQQVTCVPYLDAGRFGAMTRSEIDALPPGWCLMRSADKSKAGWVAQQFITPDQGMKTTHAAVPTDGELLIVDAQTLVRRLYQSFQSIHGPEDSPFSSSQAGEYFFAEIVPQVAGHGLDLLYDAQDFDGSVIRIVPDPEQPMFRGMVTIQVDFTNFGQQKRATYRLRSDTGQPGAPVRIFRIEHENWSFPE